ncbi:MAG: nitroreductase [Verrucomicrobiales bacterium]|jgi:nitroreductase
MSPIPPQQLLDALNWRYAVKKFDSERKIPAETWDALEKALVLTPSSYGLQPWKFYVITDQGLKDSLVAASYNQTQPRDCSHLLVIAVKKTMEVADVDRLMDAVAEIQRRPRESTEGYRKMMIGDIVDGPRGKDSEGWAKLQSYIALGNFMTAAALLGVDACPMEGFVPAMFDEALGLAEKGLTTAVLCAAGYRSAEDNYAAAPKVRYALEELIERV